MEDVARGWRLGRSLHIKDPLRSSLSGIHLLVANELRGEIIIRCICALNINFLRVYLDKLILFHCTLKLKMRLFNRVTHFPFMQCLSLALFVWWNIILPLSAFSLRSDTQAMLSHIELNLKRKFKLTAISNSENFTDWKIHLHPTLSLHRLQSIHWPLMFSKDIT